MLKNYICENVFTRLCQQEKPLVIHTHELAHAQSYDYMLLKRHLRSTLYTGVREYIDRGHLHKSLFCISQTEVKTKVLRCVKEFFILMKAL